MFIKSDDEIVKKFYNMQSRLDVANLLEINEKSLRYFLYKRRPDNMYSTFVVVKRNGDFREICSPFNELKNIQNKLKYVLELVYKPKICAYGFIKGKNIVQNANNHIKKSVILNIDLKDFFKQINFGRVRGLFLAKPYSIGEEAATVISQIVCYNGYLPQGAPTSPIIANMICVPLDNALMNFSRKHKIRYSRYADDLLFSKYSSGFTSNIINKVGEKIILGKDLADIITKNGFNINPDKIYLRYKNQRQEVTGLVVNKFPNLKRNYIKNLRAILHNCETVGIYESAIRYANSSFCHNNKIKNNSKNPDNKESIIKWFSQVIKGKIEYIRQVKGAESTTFITFAKKANQVFKKDLFGISALIDRYDIINKNVFIIESEEYDNNIFQGSGFYIKGIGLITSYHLTECNANFHVYTIQSYKNRKSIATICNLNKISSDKNIDYALYNVSINDTFSIKCGDSQKINIGDTVTIAGYPNYSTGNSATIQTCEITGRGNFLGALFYKVNGRIVHGASGGIVLNRNNEVIGIAKGGIISLNDDNSNDNQGFVPIHLALDHIKNKSDN